MYRSAVFVVAGGLFSSMAHAEPSLFDCRVIAEADGRLACYDALVDRLQPAPRPVVAGRTAAPAPAAGTPVSMEAAASEAPEAVSPPVQATAEAQKQTLRERLFGSQQESQEVLGEILGESAESLDQQADEVAAVTRDPYDRMVIRLANGQIWLQTDTQRLSLEAGDQVIIHSSKIGSYQLEKASGSRRIRVRRTS